MSSTFSKNLKVVTGVHVVLITLLFTSGWLKSLRKPKKETVIPLEFLVAVPPSEPEPPVNDIPNPAAPPKKPPRKTPPKPPKKDPIKISTKPATNPNRKPPPKPLTPEQIKKMLESGAKPSDRTVIPDDDSLHFALVRQAFHDAWAQPSSAEAGDEVVQAEIRLAMDGSIISARIKRPSGVAVLDSSVSRALKYVKKVSGLTRDFLSRHDTITVSFRVE